MADDTTPIVSPINSPSSITSPTSATTPTSEVKKNKFVAKLGNLQIPVSQINNEESFPSFGLTPRNTGRQVDLLSPSWNKHSFRPKERIHLSDFFPRPPRKINPLADAVELQVRDFIHTVTKDYAYAIDNTDNYLYISSYLYPQAPAPKLKAIALLNSYLFIIDDILDDIKEKRIAQDTPEVAELRKNPRLLLEATMKNVMILATRELKLKDKFAPKIFLHNEFLELSKMLYKLSNPQWVIRLVHTIKQLAMSEVRFKKDNDIEDYLKRRAIESNAYVALDCIEFAYDCFLPEHILKDEKIQRLKQKTCAILGIENDIVSYEKEVLQNGIEANNLLALLLRMKKCTFEESLKFAFEIMDKQIVEFKSLFDEIMAVERNETEKEMVKVYLEGAQDLVAGLWNWMMRTNRYKSKTSFFYEFIGLPRRPSKTVSEIKM